MTADKAQTLCSAHEVQRFHRDVDETKDWILEKDSTLNNENYGHDLASVQALQRKHEGLERDLAALGEKVGLTLVFRICLKSIQIGRKEKLVISFVCSFQG